MTTSRELFRVAMEKLGISKLKNFTTDTLESEFAGEREIVLSFTHKLPGDYSCGGKVDTQESKFEFSYNGGEISAVLKDITITPLASLD